ncbi:MAG: type I-C CRISPR-associated protein Cas8c/Csd1 [Ruminococcus sp.]|nr:type I-C CRISPR-associated protein Cas8c/Csd1 [Ruminococcus sp.]
MLIKALCDYADKRERGSKEKDIPKGWCEQKVHFKINLSPEGNIVSITDERESKPVKKKNGKESVTLEPVKVLLPERTQKPGIDSNFIEHRPLYIFGLNFDKGVFTTEDKTDKAKKSHKAFAEHELAFFDGLDSEICLAYRKFIEKWEPQAETENPELLKLGKDYKNSYFRFALTGGRGFLDEDEQFKEKYDRIISEKAGSAASESEELPVCGILGEKAPTARIHDKIKNFPGVSTGGVLVGMKYSAFESYGKTQSYNSNISEPAMKKYTSTLSMLLEDKSHHAVIDDMVLVFFAMKEDDSNECDRFWSFLSDSPGATETEQFMQSMFDKVKGGATGDTSFEADSNVTFYIAGLTANSSRICQKFLHRSRFGDVIDNLLQHQKDMQINPENDRQIRFCQITKQLVLPKRGKDNKNKTLPPPLTTSIMLSAFDGTDYPNALLETVVRRVKTDSDDEKNRFIKMNDTRIGIIKACINRKLRRAGKKEEITMALNTENKDPAYLCGRLFAVYEKIQKDASGDLNRTIKDAYFSSACVRPSVIMPKLSQLANNHMRKLTEGTAVFYNNLIGEITDGLEGTFPRFLGLDSQGKFIIGYYQQNKALYTSNKKDNGKEDL